MNEHQLLDRIHNVAEHYSRELLIRFWLQMDARPTVLPFTFDDLRHLNGECRSIFHVILGSYAREQFAPLSESLVCRLGELLAEQPPHATEMSSREDYLHYLGSLSRYRALMPQAPAGVMA